MAPYVNSISYKQFKHHGMNSVILPTCQVRKKKIKIKNACEAMDQSLSKHLTGEFQFPVLHYPVKHCP